MEDNNIKILEECKKEFINFEYLKYLIDNNDNDNDIIFVAFLNICKNINLTINMLELFFLNKNLEILFLVDWYENTGIMYLCKNSKISIEILELFFSNINLSTNEIQNILSHENFFKDSILIYLCNNENITYKILKYFIFNLNILDEIQIINIIFHKNDKLKNSLWYICNNKNFEPKMLKLFIHFYDKEDFLKEIPINILENYENNINYYYNIKYCEFITK